MNFKFVCTYRPFNYRGQPNVALYAKNDGGLHLNTEGSRRLSHFFSASHFSFINADNEHKGLVNSFHIFSY